LSKTILVKKRNGDVEAFDPEKLTRWAKWAGEVGADWFGIVAETYKKLPEECTTVELQNAMIQACMDMEDTPHMLMAGRLLIGDVYKQAFGGHDHIPTMPEMYHKMVVSGLWENMGYSDYELNILQGVIDHNKDLNSVHSVIHQISTKYALRDIEKNIALESPAFVWMRMALGVCKDEPVGTRVEEVIKYYKKFSESNINAPTPNIVNLGTEKRSYASCCVFKSGDDAGSLAAGDHIAYTMTCASAGIGGYIETRSKGDGVRNNTIKHSGKLPYYRATEAAVHANLQGGRGGAATVHFNCLDPEVETLLRLRHPTTVAKQKIGGIDYSFGYHPYFAEKAAKNEKWMLISFKAAPDLYKKMYSDDYKGFVELYEKYATTGKRKFINARKLALEFLRMQQETGRMYEHNTYEMNRHTPFKDTIWSSNLCVAPETRILTKDGYKEISSLRDQKVEIWNGKEWSLVDVVKTGENRKLLRVVTKDGFELECTEDHKFYLSVRNTGGTTWTIEKRAKDLQKGDKLIKFDLPIIEGTLELDHAYANGFYSGDGCVVGNKQRLYFYGEKKAIFDELKDIFVDKIVQPNQDRIYAHTTKLKEKFFVPDCQYSIKSRLEWLAGLMDSDGTVSVNGNTQSYQIGSVEPEFLKEVQMMLQTTGVRSKVTMNAKAAMRPLPANDGTGQKKMYQCKTSYRLLIGNDGLSKLADMGLKTRRLIVTSHRPNRECSQFIKIESVIDEGRYDDTYCFTEHKRHLGMFNGILTGQCQEIGLPTNEYKNVTDLYSEEATGEIGLCNLAAIVAGKVAPEDYEETAYLALKMVDNVISIMDYPFHHLKRTAQARRSAGIGITNLAHDMATKGLTYDSTEGKAYMHRLAEMHSFYLHKASVRLAKERGKCEWFDKTKYAEGWLPIDTYAKHVDNIMDQPLLLDWEGLREEIKLYGMRNSVLEAFMPVESSSIAGNTTNSLYPVRELVVVKTSGTNKTVFLAPDLEKLKGFYQSAYDVATKDLIEMYAIFQKFCGQAISADDYRQFEEGKPKQISAKELLSNWFYRIKCGMKTKYYTNTAAGLKVEDDCESCKL
jgi:ribonucleoside-diphosphate reductase alpha chain